MPINIYRGSDVVAQLPDNENIIYKHSLMSEHVINAPGMVFSAPIDIQLGDYINFKGQKFRINTVPDVQIEYDYTYDIVFEGPKYTWHDKLFMDEGSNDFTYYGNAADLMALFILNVNEIDPGWTIGEVVATEEQLIPFTGGDTGLYCYEALKQIAEAFKLEYSVVGKVINLVTKVGRYTGLSFEYGMGKGLFDLKRTYVNEKNVITKAYGFGGTKNLPKDYGKPRLTYDPGFATHNIDLYKVKEGKYVNDEIYPHREALATSVTNGTDIYTLTDTTIDFDINMCLLKNLTAKISFITGELSGETFEITGYNATTKTITYKGFTNTNNVTLPNTTFKAKVGDKYTLLDLNMPITYVTAATAQIATETAAFVLENSVPQLEYAGNVDPLHLKLNSIELEPGDRINFKDTRMGFDSTIRITEVSYPVSFPELLTNDTKVNITVANFITYTTQQRLKADMLQVKNEIQVADLHRAEAARRNSANLFNLRDLVIDPTTEKYYTGKIAAGSIETLYLAVGAKATNYSLKNISFNTNAGGNPNSFTATAGQLVHYDIKIEGAGFVWEMQPYSTDLLVPENTYYLYAKVSRDSLVGSWVVSTDIIQVESVPGFWHLQAGVLFSVSDGRRDYELTKGMSFIIGDQITAGILKSLDGLNFFNLTDGKFKLGDSLSGLDWGVTEEGVLTISGTVIATGAEFVDLIVQNLVTAIPGVKRVIINGSDNNIKIVNSANENLLLLDDDAAIISYINNPDPPYNPIPVYGPGMMIGKISDDFTSISNKSIEMSGNISALGYAVISSYLKAKHFQTQIYRGSGSASDSGLIVASGNCNLYTYPSDGQIQTVKNYTSGAITVKAAETSGRNILMGDNSHVYSLSIYVGEVVTFQYDQPTNLWVMLHRSMGGRTENVNAGGARLTFVDGRFMDNWS